MWQKNLEQLRLENFTYPLPDERIARYPLADRAASKLLRYRAGEITAHGFTEIVDQLPAEALLVYNDTKVIPARMAFFRPTGARIELFLLKPLPADSPMEQAMAETKEAHWSCMIGNARKWKAEEILQMDLEIAGRTVRVEARRGRKEDSDVFFTWSEPLPFVQIVEAMGQVPLPPYLNRAAEESDRQRYQTVFSRSAGAVAAPTAGLHFTPEILAALQAKGLQMAELTLHVGAGTFQPVKEQQVMHHAMHSEQIVVQRETVQQLMRHAGPVIPVGTTSMRSLESLYWLGVKLLKGQCAARYFHIEKLYPYTEEEVRFSRQEAFAAIDAFMKVEQLEQLTGETSIMLMPGYRFRVCDALITNFHQPGSTLILLVAAFIGEDWRKVYDFALAQDFRFLSYGDSSLLWRNAPA